MTPIEFVSQLASLRFESAFNPYSDKCPAYDTEDAPGQRSDVLVQMLTAAARVEIDALWIGRELGYRGGRRTGLAFTDDVHFHKHLSRWGVSAQRPTIGRPVPERTAGAVWRVLEGVERPVFLWNAFPLHSHQSGDPFSNRTHNAKERSAGTDVLRQLVDMLRSGRLIAVGNDAAKVVAKVSGEPSVQKVRHPSFGGQVDFLRQMESFYGFAERRLL